MSDDYYDAYVDDGVTSNSIDPGAPLFLGTLSFCVGSLLVLPIFVAIGNRRARLRRAKKEFESRGGGGRVDSNLNTTLSDDRSFSDQISVDGCHGRNTIEDILEDGGMVGGGCCISMMCDDDQLMADNVNEISEQHVDNNFDNSLTERRIRKSKSAEDLSSDNALDEAKRTRRLLSDDIDTSSAGVARQHHSFSIGAHKQHEEYKVTPDPPSPEDKASPEAKGTTKKKKILFKRAIKAVTKKRLIQPLSQTQHIPKKSFLDGGFYAPGNLRLHHQILQSDLDRERRKEKKRRKRKKKDKSYVPPTVPTTEAESSVNRLRDNSFDQDSVYTSTSSNFDEEVINDVDIMFGEQSPYHPKKRKYIWNHFVRMAKFDHESKRLVSLMAPYTLTALICNMFAIVEIALISSVLGAESLSAFLVTGYFLSMVYKAAKGFTDAEATLCAHAVGAGNYFLAGQYIQLTQVVFVLTAFPPLLLMASFMYQLLVSLDVDSDVAALGGSFAAVQVIALLVCGFNDAHMQFLSAIDPSNNSNAIEILMNASYTAAIAVYLHSSENATLVGLAWMKCCVAILFIPINIAVLSSRGWLDLCWVGMVRSNALKNREVVKQMYKTGVPLGIGYLIRESEWGLLVLFSSRIGTDDVATFAVIRRTFDIFSSLIEGLCCGAELRCAYHMGRGNQVLASRSAYKSLIIGMSVGTALAFSYYGLLGNYVFQLLDYDNIGPEMKELIPMLFLCSIVMIIGMLGWALLGAQSRVRLATFVSMVTSWIITIPIAAYFVIVRNYNLQGLVAAVTVGYSVSSTILMYLLISSNWKKRSAKVKRAASFSVASIRDDESIMSTSICGNDDAALSQVGSSPPIKDLTLTIPSILVSSSDVMEMVEQLGDAVPSSIRPDSENLQSDA